MRDLFDAYLLPSQVSSELGVAARLADGWEDCLTTELIKSSIGF